MKSPVDGVVLNVYQHVGGTLNTGVAIFEIGDAKQMTIESDVLSDRVHDMRVRQTVSVGLSRAKFIYSGTISRINPKRLYGSVAIGCERATSACFGRFN